VQIPVVGLIENMSGFTCPHCAECTYLFSSGGGSKIAADFKVPYWGSVPIEPNLTTLIEKGTYCSQFTESSTYVVIKKMIDDWRT
jgi:hypothetical protein